MDPNELINRYFATWNEPDAERRRALIAEVWAADGSYLDPVASSQGHAAIDSMIAAVQQRFAGHRFRQVSAVDAHHDRLRFSWVLAPESGPAVAAGSDFGVLAADGRLQAITGFFDPAPTA